MRLRQRSALLARCREESKKLAAEVDTFTTAEPFRRYEEAHERAARIATEMQTLANDARTRPRREEG
jgi:hypothetical protein